MKVIYHFICFSGTGYITEIKRLSDSKDGLFRFAIDPINTKLLKDQSGIPQNSDDFIDLCFRQYFWCTKNDNIVKGNKEPFHTNKGKVPGFFTFYVSISSYLKNNDTNLTCKEAK